MVAIRTYVGVLDPNCAGANTYPEGWDWFTHTFVVPHNGAPDRVQQHYAATLASQTMPT